MEKIKIETRVKSTLENVWQKWTGAEHIVNWNFASDDWHCPKATNDPQTGGKFSSTMASKDGSMNFDFEGVYDEVVPQTSIAYTMSDGRKVLIEFKEEGDAILITETFDPESQNPIEMQQAGWQAILNNFKSYTEQ